MLKDKTLTQVPKILFLFALILFANSPIEAKINDVSLVLPWKHQFQFAGYYIAKEKGYYKNLGLNVEIKEYESNRDNTAYVAAGKAQFGVGHSSLILDLLKKQHAIVLLAAINQSSPLVLLAKKQESIKVLANIVNKKVMITNDQSFLAAINAMLISENIKPSSFKIIDTTFNPIALINGQADLMTAYSSNEPYILKEKGVEYTIFDPKDYGYDFYSDLLFTSEKMLQDSPEIVNAFYAASIKGWLYAYSHINETAKIILNKYNTQNKNLSALLFEGQTLKKLAIKKGLSFGYLDPIRLREMANTYQLLGLSQVNNLNFKKIIYQPSDGNKQLLSKSEMQYLLKKKVISICVSDNNMPFEGVKNETITGISADYLAIIKKKLNIQFNYISVSNKVEANAFLQQKKCDLITSITDRETTKGSTLSTQAYLDIPLILLSQEKIPFIYNAEDFTNKSIGVIKGQYNNELDSQMELQVYPSLENAFELLESKKIDGLITDQLSYHKIKSQYILTHPKLESLLFAHKLEQSTSIYFTVHGDNKILFNILEKQISAINANEKSQILDKWLSAEYIPILDKKFILLMVGILLFIIMLSYIINIRLKKMVKARTRELNQQLNIFDNYVIASRTDTMGIINYVSKEFCRSSGYTEKELIGKTHNVIRDKETSNEVYLDLWMTITSGHVWKGQIKNRSKDGRECWYDTIINPLFSANKNILGFEAICHNITVEKLLQDFNKNLELKVANRTRELHHNQQFLDMLFDVNPSIAFVLKADKLIRVNKEFLAFTQYSSLEEFLQQHKCISELFEKKEGYFSPEHDTIKHLKSDTRNDKAMIIKEGKETVFTINIKSFIIDDICHDLVLLQNITDIEKLANTDKLTNIYNRYRLDQELKHAINNFQRYGDAFSIIIIDIDHFKNINDTYGHPMGDEILQSFTQLIKQTIRNVDILGRWGGEEFMIINNHTKNMGSMTLAEKIRKTIQDYPFQLTENITASFGVAQIKADMDIQKLIHKADQALYQAKKRGRNKVIQG